MNVQLLVQNNRSGAIYDISDLVLTLSLSTELDSQPGKLEFSFLDDNQIYLYEGSPVSLKINDAGIFFGYVFKQSRTKEESISILAYDQLRYWKNKDTYVLSGLTADQIFERICKDTGRKYAILQRNNYICAPRTNDSKGLYEIVNYATAETLIKTGNWYIIRDNYGVLEFRNLAGMRTNLFIGDESLLLDYSYERSIDDDTFNQIKLVQENKETAKRDVYLVKDSGTIKAWGTLQYFETMDENANAAQIQERAEQLLRLKNRVTEKISLECLGDITITAGSGIVLGVDRLSAAGLPQNKYYIVTRCTHKFQKDYHTMSLELAVSV